ncbi:MAG: glycosyltransferase [Syntrophomonadaceae bacterium]|nr:glycosyltransferase [Syntrophomonadaceae bacterium]
MRIVIGSESFYPNISGVSVTTFNLASYLAGKGHQVVVIAPSPSRHGYRERFPEDFTVWRIGSVPNIFRKGFRVTVYPWRQVQRLLAEFRPEVIHLQDPTSIGSALLRAARGLGLPVVTSHHFTFEYVLAYLWFLKPLHPFLLHQLSRRMVNFYNCCQQVICPSETVKRELLDIGLKTPVATISNGVNLSRFFSYQPAHYLRAIYRLPAVPLVLYVGRMDLEKNIETLLEAVPRVLERNRAHFVLCGSGNRVNRLKKQVEKKGLAEQVSFLGPFDFRSPELPGIYQLASLFVIPSGIESQSMVTLEAMACGLPVVAARGGALPELVADGDNGFLFLPDNPAEMAEKINLLLENGELRRVMGQRSLEKAVQHDLEGSLARIEAIYYRVVEKTSA